MIFERGRGFSFPRRDLHPSSVTLPLSPLSEATYIRGEANAGQGQSFALAEHKCITSGSNYPGITRHVALCHCASHNRFKQVENVFRGGGAERCACACACAYVCVRSVADSLWEKYAFNIIKLHWPVLQTTVLRLGAKIYLSPYVSNNNCLSATRDHLRHN